MSDTVTSLIQNKKALPEFAVEQAIDIFSSALASVNDPLISARVSDLQDIKKRLIRNLRGEVEDKLSFLSEPVILVAHELLPSDTATIDLDHILGIITETGSETSHSAILARSFRIPALLGVADAMKTLEEGVVALDALDGIIIKDPTVEERAKMEKKRLSFIQRRAEEEAFRNALPLTKDGVKVDIGINIGANDSDDGFALCDFVGLFRTEFLYMSHDHLPTEEEQYQAYTRVLCQANGRPVTLRTLDIGGDKTLPYLEVPKEDNPFLGMRALRLCLAHPELFKPQLRAALRASAMGPLWLMFPMVSSIDDIRRIKTVVESVKCDLRSEAIPYDEKIKLGIMVEIPSIALVADLAAKEVDFASIGTNDLCQYTMATDRMSTELHDYYQPLSPAMLRIMQMTISAFKKEGKPISVCGELGGDPVATVAFVGMGIRKISMNTANIARVKAALAKSTVKQSEASLQRALSCNTEEEVRKELISQLY